jgi:hypothetical protein
MSSDILPKLMPLLNNVKNMVDPDMPQKTAQNGASALHTG